MSSSFKQTPSDGRPIFLLHADISPLTECAVVDSGTAAIHTAGASQATQDSEVAIVATIFVAQAEAVRTRAN